MRNTPNYNLPQYEGTDKFTKEVLNDAFTKVDTAINDLQETFNINGSTSTLTTQEVVNARNGKQNLKERIDEIDEQMDSNTNGIGILKTKYVNVLEFGAKGDGVTDDTIAIKEALSLANGKDRSEQITLFFPKGTYIISSKISPPTNTTLRIEGENQRSCYIKPSPTFSDNCLFELNSNSKSIYLKNIAFTGNGNRSISAIECVSGSHGMLYFDNVICGNLRYLIRGGGSSEFPLGGTFKDVYCLNNYIGGIYLGTETKPLSGQSCFTFDNVIITSASMNPINYNTFSVSTNGDIDTITVDTTTTDDFGAILMYQKEDSSWEHVSIINKGLTNKQITFNNGGKNINYKLIQNTVGIYLKHLKAINIGVLQCEYVGVGLYLDYCRAIKVNSFYNEYRNKELSNPIPQGYGIWLNATEGFVIDTAWLEGMYHGIYSYNNTFVKISAITGNVINSIVYSYQISNQQLLNVDRLINKGCIYEVAHGDPSNRNYDITSIDANGNIKKDISALNSSELSLSRRGVKKGSVVANSDGLAIDCNSLNVNVGNTIIKPLVYSGNQKSIGSNIVTPLFSFPMSTRNSIDFTFHICAIGGVIRQSVSGSCIIDTVITDINRSSVNTIVRNKLQQAGTITDPVFSVSIENGICTVSVTATSSNCTDVRIGFVVNSLIGNSNHLISIL